MPILVTKAHAAKTFGVRLKTTDNYSKDGALPPPIPFGGRHFWRPEVFNTFIDAKFKDARATVDVTNENVENVAIREIQPAKAKAVPPRDSFPSVRQATPTTKIGRTERVK